jgi:hypothetical protein
LRYALSFVDSRSGAAKITLPDEKQIQARQELQLARPVLERFGKREPTLD